MQKLNPQSLFVAACFLLQLAPNAVAQQTQPMIPAPETPQQRIQQDEKKEAQSFNQNNPNWAQNHPEKAQYYKDHPEAKAKALGKYGEKQFGENHPNFAQNHPQQAKFDGKHPLWAEGHPKRALGRH